MSLYHKVVIVGRTNVGKSTLFNRFSVNVKSLTLDFHGVTRDFLKDIVTWKDRTFELMDTGGVSLRKTDDTILERVRAQAISLIEQADLVLFVCDAQVGVVPEDREIAKLLHKMKKEVILVLNKHDSGRADQNEHEFVQLGYKIVAPISAQHGRGISDLLETVLALLPKNPKTTYEELPRYKVVFLGKPNVGKSSLMNLLLKQERSIVTPIAGTTREAISENIKFYQEDILITDTPGIRRKRSVSETIETMMVKSSLRALQDADIVLMMLDASEGQIADQELKLAFYSFTEQYKALILLFNKQDLVSERAQETMKFSLEPYAHLMKKVVSLSISCKSGRNIGKILPLVQTIWERHSQEFSESELTMLLKDALKQKPLFHKTQPLALFRVTQIKSAPITLVLVVNQPEWFGPSQLGFFENVLRKNYDLVGVPVRLVTRKAG